jgi:hypothetical protein
MKAKQEEPSSYECGSLPERCGQLLAEYAVRLGCRPGKCSHHHVCSRLHLAEHCVARRLEASPHPVAHNGDANGFRDDEAEAGSRGIGLLVFGCTKVRHGIGGHKACAPPDHTPIVIGGGDPVGVSQHSETRWLLRGELGATLAATSAQDGAPCTGAHTQTEPVHLGATTVVRLESSLAHGVFSVARTSSRVHDREPGK